MIPGTKMGKSQLVNNYISFFTSDMKIHYHLVTKQNIYI